MKASLSSTLVLLLLIPGMAMASGNSLVGSIEAFRVVQTAGGEEFMPADKASPNDVIEYRLTYRNDGQEPVRNIFITDPIPAGTEYIDASASPPANGHVQFSIDRGKTFHEWPIIIERVAPDGRKTRIEATPDQVTHIRWVVTDTFKPSGEVTVSYRTTIK